MKAARHRASIRSIHRLRQMYEKLVEEYGPQQWWPAATPFEVVIGAYLTQNTSWRGVEKSIANLAQLGALSVEGIRQLSEEELRQIIRPSGYMVRKAAALQAFVKFLDREYGGCLERFAVESTEAARQKLLGLPGVGPETADAILLYALGHPAMVVDEYLRRIVTRHELLPGSAKYSEVQSLAIQTFDGFDRKTLVQHYNEFHALVVMIGKTYCGPRPKCENCPLRGFLPPQQQPLKAQDREGST